MIFALDHLDGVPDRGPLVDEEVKVLLFASDERLEPDENASRLGGFGIGHEINSL